MLADAWSWFGVIIVRRAWIIHCAGRAGGVFNMAAGGSGRAALLGPLEQARLHTLASLNKHVGLGAWFAAIAAGYTVGKLVAAAPTGRTRVLPVARRVALVFPISLGASQSRVFASDWPNSASFTAIFRPAGRSQHRAPAGRGSLHR